MCAILHVHLLGDFRLVSGDTLIVGVTSARLQSFVAYLALHRHAQVSRSQLAYTFWPESSESRAYLSLRKVLHTLRRALPGFEELVRVDGAAVQWRPDGPFTLDVAMFESALAEAEKAQALGAEGNALAALQGATNLYEGDLLPNCYDEWVLPERERLREAFVSALQRLIGLLSPSGDFGTVIAYAQRLLRYDPLREESYRLLMRLYASAGDLAGATRTYRRCEATLQRELEVEPSQETRELYASLVDGASVAPTPVETRPNNLPAQASTFIGRERQLATASTILRRPEVRLVTFTGTAGTGKTRLALQLASDLLNSFEHGVFFVPLAPVTEQAQVIPAIAQSLGVREAGGKDLFDSLKDYLREKRLLLLLDNFEQVASAAPTLADLLAACPGLKIMVTSRAALHLRGEKEFPVPPLGLPDTGYRESLEELAQHEAVALFTERVMDVKPDFAFSRNNAGSIAEICRQLEGLPLAIELAAARVKVLSPQAIAARLGEQGGKLKLLVGGALDLPPRQQALRNAIAWSYDLLDKDEQALFRRLGVFLGGFTLKEVETVALPSGMDVVEGLGSLVDKNLLRRSERLDGESRFWMLETLREYALERLAEAGEDDETRDRHLAYFVVLAEEATPKLISPEQQEWLSRLEDEHDNLRAALDWSLSAEEPETGLHLSATLAQFWQRRNHRTEGIQWMSRALGREGGSPRGRATVLSWMAVLVRQQDDYARADMLAGEALSIFRQIGDKQGIADALLRRSTAVRLMSNYEEAIELLHACLPLFREIGDEFGEAYALYGLGRISDERADYTTSIDYFEQSLSILRRMGDKIGISDVLASLSWSLLGHGEYDRAMRVSEELLEIAVDMNDQMIATDAHNTMAVIAQQRGDYQQAITLLEKNLTVEREWGLRGYLSVSLNNLGHILLYAGEYERAKPLLRESLQMLREMGDRLRSTSPLVNLGHIALLQGDCDEARALLRQALTLAQEIGAKRIIAECLQRLASVSVAEMQLLRAARLFGSMERLREVIGHPMRSHEQADYDRDIFSVREALDAEAFGAAFAEGRAMELEEAVGLALQE